MQTEAVVQQQRKAVLARRDAELKARDEEHDRQMADRIEAQRRWAAEAERWRAEFDQIAAGEIKDPDVIEARWDRLDEEAIRRAEEVARWAREDRERDKRMDLEDERMAREIAAWVAGEEGRDGRN